MWSRSVSPIAVDDIVEEEVQIIFGTVWMVVPSVAVDDIVEEEIQIIFGTVWMMRYCTSCCC